MIQIGMEVKATCLDADPACFPSYDRPVQVCIHRRCISTARSSSARPPDASIRREAVTYYSSVIQSLSVYSPDGTQYSMAIACCEAEQRTLLRVRFWA